MNSPRDDDSIKRFGLRSLKRSDLTPNAPNPVLPNLASTFLERWRDGDATITSVGVNLVVETGAADALTALFSGDVINVVDLVPAGSTDDEWMITTTEVAGMSWNMAPDAFDLEMTLDE